MKQNPHLKKIYFLGIAGTGMASVAGLAKDLGYEVCGSDQQIYPPMSTMLESIGIPVLTPYQEANILTHKPQQAIIANALSRGNVELEYILKSQIPYTSFAQWMGENILEPRHSIVVCGTHGKTTTSSLLSYCLKSLNEDPGYLIGGIPRNFPRSYEVGKGSCFVIEGDEYDTAFFDKGPKFLHYRPKMILLNNIEFDHADIYKNQREIEIQFEKLLSLCSDKSQIIANVDNEGVNNVLKNLGIEHKVVRVSTEGKNKNSDYVLTRAQPKKDIGPLTPHWEIEITTPSKSENHARFETNLVGNHNAANIAMVYASLRTLSEKSLIAKIQDEAIQKALNDFKGVTRRLDHLYSKNGFDVFEDFAHHPSAIRTVIDGIRKSFPGRRLIVAFEPRNATGRRNVFQNEFATALKDADIALIGHCPTDNRIPENERMNTKAMANSIGAKATAFETNESLLKSLKEIIQSGDLVVFMTSSSFSGVQYGLKEGN